MTFLNRSLVKPFSNTSLIIFIGLSNYTAYHLLTPTNKIYIFKLWNNIIALTYSLDQVGKIYKTWASNVALTILGSNYNNKVE